MLVCVPIVRQIYTKFQSKPIITKVFSYIAVLFFIFHQINLCKVSIFENYLNKLWYISMKYYVIQVFVDLKFVI